MLTVDGKDGSWMAAAIFNASPRSRRNPAISRGRTCDGGGGVEAFRFFPPPSPPSLPSALPSSLLRFFRGFFGFGCAFRHAVTDAWSSTAVEFRSSLPSSISPHPAPEVVPPLSSTAKIHVSWPPASARVAAFEPVEGFCSSRRTKTRPVPPDAGGAGGGGREGGV